MARAAREAERLNTPGRRRRSTIPTIKVDREAFGKFAEGFARFMGTARFLFGMTVVIVFWILWNLPYGPPRPHFDTYPFRALTINCFCFGISTLISCHLRAGPAGGG